MKIRPVSQLQAVTMVDPGSVCKIWGQVFVAGVLPIKVARFVHIMAIIFQWFKYLLFQMNVRSRNVWQTKQQEYCRRIIVISLSTSRQSKNLAIKLLVLGRDFGW